MVNPSWVVVALLVGAAGYLLGRRAGGAGDGVVPAVEPAEPEPVPTAAEGARDEGLLGRLVQALDRVDQGIVVCDEDASELFRNRVAAGYTEARDALVLVEAAIQEQLAAALAGNSSRRAVDLFGPPAQYFVVHARTFLDGSGAFAVVEDHTAGRRTETVRRDFVSNISHELKTPIGALGLLAETIRGEDDPAVVDRLAARMTVEAERVSSTVDDLLELSSIEFGAERDLVLLDAAEVIEEAVARMAPAAEQAGIELDVTVEADLSIRGDRRQLVSALFNLVDNAVKYSSRGAAVRITASTTVGRIELAVTDHGVGIPRRDLDRIFERFYRVDRARSRETGGTGLGLAIVRHIANNHGGEVTVESTEGVGTTFTVWLPDPFRVSM